MIVFRAFVVFLFSFSLNLSDSVVLAFLLTIVPKALEHCYSASFVESGLVGLRLFPFFMLMCIGLKTGLLAIFG